MDTTTAPHHHLGRRTRHIVGVLLAAALLVIGAAACQPAGCAADCVASVTIAPGANQATVKTTVTTFVTLDIYSDAGMTTRVVHKSDTGINASHVIDFTQLISKTNYWYRVTAIDVNNKTHVEEGSFATDKRQVTVTIDRIHLIDDSDSLGDGEMSFHMLVNSTEFDDVYDNWDMSSGTDITNLAITRTVPNSGSTLIVKIEGQDDDCDTWDGLCVGGLGADWGHGSTSEMDWATGSSGPTALPTTNGSGTWSVYTNSYAVGFEASGTYSVTYIPV